MGFRRYDSGVFNELWHAYIQVGVGVSEAWTIGWNGDVTFAENLMDGSTRHTNLHLSRLDSGTLPGGPPCPCASPQQLQECVMNSTGAYPETVVYEEAGDDCGDWVEYVLEKCEL